MGVAAVGLGAAGGFQEVEQGIEAQEAQQHGIDGADEHFGQQRVGIVQALVDGAAHEGTGTGAHQERDGQLDGHVAQLFVDRGAHDGLGEDVEQVRTDGQDALDARGHQGRGDDEAATGADAAGDEAGRQADGDGGQENGGGVEGRRIRAFAAQHLVGFIGFGTAHKQDGRGQGQQEQHLFAVLDDGRGDFQVPFGIRLRAA